MTLVMQTPLLEEKTLNQSISTRTVLFTLAILGLLAGGCSIITRWGNTTSENYMAPKGTAAQEIARGKMLFIANCQRCHGENAGGTWRMPSLVSQSYGPKNFKDRRFYIAVSSGARSRYWLNFQDMQPIKGLSQEDAKSILHYVRDLQKQVGIF